MTNESLHGYLRDLLAPAALHSCSIEEQHQVEEHVATCDECRIEFDENRRVAALLGASPAMPPERVWEKLSVQIQEPPPPVQLVRVKRRGPVARFLPVAAGLALVVGGVVAGLSLSNEMSDDEVSPIDLASEARETNGAHDVALRSSDASVLAHTVVTPGGQAYLYEPNLPELDPDRIYQLWAINDGVPVSAGTFDDAADVVAFNIDNDIDAIAITVERSGGVSMPTSAPMATASLT